MPWRHLFFFRAVLYDGPSMLNLEVWGSWKPSCWAEGLHIDFHTGLVLLVYCPGGAFSFSGSFCLVGRAVYRSFASRHGPATAAASQSPSAAPALANGAAPQQKKRLKKRFENTFKLRG